MKPVDLTSNEGCALCGCKRRAPRHHKMELQSYHAFEPGDLAVDQSSREYATILANEAREEDEQKRLVNTYDRLSAAVTAKLLPKKHAVAISSQAYEARRAGGGTHAWSPFFQTDPRPDCAWYHYHKKVFFGAGFDMKGREDAIEQAKAWVRETYGYAGEWKRNAFRDWVPAIVQESFPIKRRPKLVKP